MTQRRKKRRRSSKTSDTQQFPGWLWMLFGLSLGLSVAFAIYVKDNPSDDPSTPRAQPQPASMQASLDDNSEAPGDAESEREPEKKERRFTFYELLPNFELTIPEKRPDVEADIAPAAVVEPGVYVLQAGSFSTNEDADRRRAELALQGIESHIQRVKINDKNYHRVYIGPTDDLDKLNMLRSRLRSAKIDVFRIRISD
ncbi:MAG: SPOR domain-containing protein [Gammaproteobacteria bacterium]|nr:SPOR domain-containing protein [Gammaproteobacteria bacterium]MDH3415245.1 SPOR domain-containing protein [Gammaproteobacteria bacterium]